MWRRIFPRVLFQARFFDSSVHSGLFCLISLKINPPSTGPVAASFAVGQTENYSTFSINVLENPATSNRDLMATSSLIDTARMYDSCNGPFKYFSANDLEV